MADAGEYPLFDRPGVRTVAQHLQIVVGLEQEQVDSLKLGFDVGRDVAQVGGKGHADAFGPEDEAYRVSGIVGDGEGADGDVADGEGLAGLKVLDWRAARWGLACGRAARSGGCSAAMASSGAAGLRRPRQDRSRRARLLLQPQLRTRPGVRRPVCGTAQATGHRSSGGGGEPAHPGAVSGLGEVDRNAEFAGGDGEAVDVVHVLMGDDDGVEGVGVFAGQLHAAEEFAAAQAAIDEDAGAAAGDNRAVAFGARGQTVKRTIF